MERESRRGAIIVRLSNNMRYSLSYLCRFLDVLKHLCSVIQCTEQVQKLGKIENILLTVKAKIEPIYKLHQNLRERLVSAAEVYLKGTYSRGKNAINIGEVFIEMRNQFLVYAPVAELREHARKAIDIAKLTEMKNLDRIEHMMRRYKEESENKSIPTDLNDLLIRPVQHIMR